MRPTDLYLLLAGVGLHSGMACFEECGCTCYQLDGAFDLTIARETRLSVSLREVLDARVGWYHEAGTDGPFPRDVAGLGLGSTSGVYILWHQAGYCDQHDAEHLQAFYVGKAGKGMTRRLKAHQADKEIGGELTVEISVWSALNRHAKYVEQLLLDLYDFPLNTAENPGVRRLCQHISPAEWN